MSSAKNRKPEENLFIPITELGLDPSQYRVNLNELQDALYDSYCACCSDPNADKAPSCEQDFGKDKDLDVCEFAVGGRAGQYRWYALTNLYEESIHKLDDFKKRHNRHHYEAACDPFTSPSENLTNAINNTYEVWSYLKNPVVVNTSILSSGFNQSAHDLETYLMNFFQQNFLDEVLYSADGKIKVHREKIKGKDVIIPQVLATNSSLKRFVALSKTICKCGAKSVTGIFVTRLKPASDGTETKSISPQNRIQPLGPRFSLDFLSNLGL